MHIHLAEGEPVAVRLMGGLLFMGMAATFGWLWLQRDHALPIGPGTQPPAWAWPPCSPWPWARVPT